MAETWVVNASPLISLSKIGRIDILCEAGRKVVTPPGVREEFLQGDTEPFPEELGVLDEVEVVPNILMWGLGKGETEVLSYCHGRSDVEAIIDDLAARRRRTKYLGSRHSGPCGIGQG